VAEVDRTTEELLSFAKACRIRISNDRFCLLQATIRPGGVEGTSIRYEELGMSQNDVHADRSYPLESYEYLRGAPMPDWAWEFLRRNPDYQSDALLGHGRGVVRERLASGVLVTRLHAHDALAERWGLCCFRRSPPDRRGGPPRLVA